MNVSRNHRMKLGTILRRRCPQCGEGQVFRSLWAMNATCPVCGLEFGRGDPGYFTGAMYFSYGMGIPIIALLTLIEWLFLPRWSLFRLVILAWVLFLPLWPLVWQYSRVAWMHFDQYFDPEHDQ